MAILNVTDLSKKQRILHLDEERSIGLLIQNMFEIVLSMRKMEIGRLKFKPLSSLNNLEISPVYLLDEASIRNLQSSEDRNIVIEAAVSLYESYTNGSVKVRLKN